MDDGAIVAIVGIVFVTLFMTVRMIVHAATGRGGKASSSKDDGDFSNHSQRELFDMAVRLQSRVETLERLLDTSQPEWRGKP